MEVSASVGRGTWGKSAALHRTVMSFFKEYGGCFGGASGDQHRQAGCRCRGQTSTSRRLHSARAEPQQAGKRRAEEKGSRRRDKVEEIGDANEEVGDGEKEARDMNKEVIETNEEDADSRRETMTTEEIGVGLLVAQKWTSHPE
ncbi:hypothetical protein NDU88_006233 [Pleurodeles waltl]|uniref:Uncharacterized protein n=1 Tax=Pleurodeles waltl TaxID=8319 RepID=A0AAV7VQ70_PLEWA|nr:hypothetical protein NDU88_006233 [Pleurodeles waltl]